MKNRVITYDLKAKASCKLYVITDVHYEAGRISELTDIIRTAIKIKPDAIIFAGDTINYLNELETGLGDVDLRIFFKDLRRFAPIYVCIGNHDQMHKDRKFYPERMTLELMQYLEFLLTIPEVTIVNNRRVTIKKGINLIGLTLPRDAYQLPGTTGTQEPPAQLQELLKKHWRLLTRRNPQETNLLFIHSPRRFTPEIVSQLKGIDYIITGHMHQGCIPFGLDEKLPGTVGLVAPGNAPFPTRARHTYPEYSDKLIVLPAYKTFAGWRRHRNALYPQSHTVLKFHK